MILLRFLGVLQNPKNCREYVCDKLREKMAEDLREVVSGDSFEKMPDTYAFELEYFLKIARAQAIP